MEETKSSEEIKKADYKPLDWKVNHRTIDVTVMADGRVSLTALLNLERNPEIESSENIEGSSEVALNFIAGKGTTLAYFKILSGEDDLTETSSVDKTESLIKFKSPSNKFQVESTVIINPAENGSGRGMYMAGPIIMTQLECQGARYVWADFDRPDAASTFTVRLSTESNKHPIVLSNGIITPNKDGPNATVTFEDTVPKPPYLFAFMAGDFLCTHEAFTSIGGEEIKLEVYRDHESKGGLTFAIDVIKNAIQFDETQYDLTYKRGIHRMVATEFSDFPAMENPSLNVFKDRYIIGDQSISTDENLMMICECVSHEFFHNQSGNLCYLANWFEVGLKESLTHFRTQEFVSTFIGKDLQRIKVARELRGDLFLKDLDKNAKAIRRKSYIGDPANNLYDPTLTYQKGAQIVRMLKVLLGEEEFKKALKKYFTRYESKPSTIDDLISVFAELAPGKIDYQQFQYWYDNPGTPDCNIQTNYDSEAGTFTLNIDQTLPTVEGYENSPFYFPLDIGLVDENGNDITLELEDDKASDQKDLNRGILHISKSQHEFKFKVPANAKAPRLSCNRSFNAPIKINYEQSTEDLIFLAEKDKDGFNRYEAVNKLITRTLAKEISSDGNTENYNQLIESLGRLIDSTEDLGLLAQMLTLPDIKSLANKENNYDFNKIHQVREKFMQDFAKKYADKLKSKYDELAKDEYGFNEEAIGRRALKNIYLAYLSKLGEPYFTLANEQFTNANNMNDKFAAMNILHNSQEHVSTVRDQFFSLIEGTPILMSKLLLILGATSSNEAFNLIRTIRNDSKYQYDNINNLQSISSALCYNLPAYHGNYQESYPFIAEQILDLANRGNTTMANRVARSAFEYYKTFNDDDPRKEAMKTAIESVVSNTTNAELSELIKNKFL